MVVLANYVPPIGGSIRLTKRIGLDITQITLEAGLAPHVDPLHGPIHWKTWWYSDELHAEVRKHSYESSAEGWHQDGDTTPGAHMDCALVFWSSCDGTQFQWQSKTWQAQPWDIVIVNNRSCLHRRPPGAAFDRLSFRQRVAIPEHLRLP